MTAALTLEHLTKRFATAAQPVVAEVSLTVEEGELLTLLGPSGCGKTTLLRMIAGLEQPTAGTVQLFSRDITSMPAGRRGMGVVFQSYALFPNLTVAENTAYGLFRDRDAKRRAQRVEEMLATVGLTEFARRYPGSLSGGQQQRVALARALAPSPKVLLLDEPFSALDARVRLRLRTDLRALQRKLGITTVLVTHDQDEALTLSDRVAVMQDGRVAQTGTPSAIYTTPKTLFIAEFVGSMNLVDALVTGGIARVGQLELPTREPLPEGAVTIGFRPEAVTLNNDASATVEL